MIIAYGCAIYQISTPPKPEEKALQKQALLDADKYYEMYLKGKGDSATQEELGKLADMEKRRAFSDTAVTSGGHSMAYEDALYQYYLQSGKWDDVLKGPLPQSEAALRASIRQEAEAIRMWYSVRYGD
jgi:hypothetical protein